MFNKTQGSTTKIQDERTPVGGRRWRTTLCVESKLPADRMKANNLKRPLQLFKRTLRENGIQNLIMVPENSGATLKMSPSNDTAARFPHQWCEGCTLLLWDVQDNINAAEIFNAKHYYKNRFQFLTILLSEEGGSRVENHCFNLNVCYVITSHTPEGNQMNIRDHFLRYNVNFIILNNGLQSDLGNVCFWKWISPVGDTHRNKKKVFFGFCKSSQRRKELNVSWKHQWDADQNYSLECPILMIWS